MSNPSVKSVKPSFTKPRKAPEILAGAEGLEPSTLGFGDRERNHVLRGIGGFRSVKPLTKHQILSGKVSNLLRFAAIALLAGSLAACSTTSGPERGVYYKVENGVVVKKVYRTETKPNPDANRSIYTLGMSKK